MKPVYIAAGVIVVVLLLIVSWYALGKSTPRFTKLPNTSLVWGKVQPGGNSEDGTYKYLGAFDDSAECEAACGAEDWCHGYTWLDENSGTYSKMCYGTPANPTQTAETGYHSGLKQEEGITGGNPYTGSFYQFKENLLSDNPWAGSFYRFKENIQGGPIYTNTQMAPYAKMFAMPQ